MSLFCLIPESGAFYIMDRGYVDFERLFTLHRTGCFFVIRTKSNNQIQASLLSSRGRIWWCSMRSDHCAEFRPARYSTS